MSNVRFGENGISRKVESQMGHYLNKIREKSKRYEREPEYIKASDSDEQNSLQYYGEEGYLDDPPGKWQVRYDNQTYIQSMVNEDKGLHCITDYPKDKWEISYSDRANVKNLEPYPVRVSIDHGCDEIDQWHVPYDNKNYVLSMLAGAGISKAWEESNFGIERIRERHGHLRNPYDYDSAEDEVIYSSYRDKRPRRESYQFDRVERNVHDYEDESVSEDEVIRPHARDQDKRPRRESYRFGRVERNVHDYEDESVSEDEITQPHARDQRRRSTNIYRFGDVERNVHDVANQYKYPRSPPRHGVSTQKGAKTYYDAINKWKSAMQTSEHERQNAYNEDLENHYNQYGVEASAHDYDETRAIRTAGARKHIVPMSYVNIMTSGSKQNGHLKQVAEKFRSQLRDKAPMRRERYERVAEDYDHIPTAGNLCDDIMEEHEDHPYDCSTAHEDSYEGYKEGEDGSQTWMSSSEKFAHVHHRSQ